MAVDVTGSSDMRVGMVDSSLSSIFTPDSVMSVKPTNLRSYIIANVDKLMFEKHFS